MGSRGSVNSRHVPPDHVPGTGGESRIRAAHSTAGARPVVLETRRAERLTIQHLEQAPTRSKARGSTPATNTIGVVITETTTRIFGDPMYSLLLKAVYDALAERSLFMMMLAPQSSRDLELAQDYLLGRNVDGVILSSLHGNDPLPGRLREHGIPAVVVGQRAKGMVASCVDSDNRVGARLAVDHLIGLGRRVIATISGDLDMEGAVGRRLGYRDARAAAGLPLDPTLEEVADYLPDRAHMAMERLLLNHPEIDAVFAASDLMAAAAVGVLIQAGRRIPEDVAIVGYDDSPTARETQPPLTSICQPVEEIGREAVNILISEMREPGGHPLDVVFAPNLVVRESTVGADAARATTVGGQR